MARGAAESPPPPRRGRPNIVAALLRPGRLLLLTVALVATGGAERLDRRVGLDHPRRSGDRRLRPRAGVAVVAALLAAAPQSGAGQTPSLRSVEEAKELLRGIDLDENGRVDGMEFVALAGADIELREAEHLPEVREEFRAWATDAYRRLFTAADLDGDGLLDLSELQFASHLSDLAFSEPTAGVDRQAPNFGTQRAVELFRSADVNGDGAVSFDEYRAVAADTFRTWGFRPGNSETERIEAETRLTFDTADVAGDGSLTFRELQYAAHLLNTFATRLVAGMLVQVWDADADGIVDKDEFLVGLAAAAGGRVEGTNFEFFVDYYDAVDADGDGRLNEDEVIELAMLILSGMRRL